MRKVSLLLSCFFIALLLAFCSQRKTQAVVDDAAILLPGEAINNMNVEAGFVIESVAAEPLIEDPVALQFDETGAMWVVEMRGYMQDKDGAGENLPLGRIKVLQDKNEDGQYETATIFLDSLIMPRAAAPVQGGVLVLEPPKLYFVANNNLRAGARTLIDSAFADGGNVEHQPNGLVRAMDNWIYSAKSDKRVRFLNGKWTVEKTQFRGQWGITQNNKGRLFYNDNSTTLMGDAFMPNVFGVNPSYQRLSRKAYGTQLVSNRVFPARATVGVNRGYEKGMLDSTNKLVNATAACGPVIYRGTNFPDSFLGNAFIMEPSGYLMKRVVLSEDSAGFVTGKLPYENREFLTATDERFRPVNAYNTPDGSLFFIDMHRGVIQHTTYLTPYLRQYIDSLKLERPIGMGRIYRVRWKAHGLLKKLNLATASAAQLAGFLENRNGWHRDMAQRLLVERGDTSAVSLLHALALRQNSIAALHALYTLEGLRHLSPKFLKTVALQTTSVDVYETCMKLLEGFPTKEGFAVLQQLAQKESTRVLLQYANSLPYFEKSLPNETKKAMLALVKTHAHDSLFIDAFVSGATGREKARLAWLGKKSKADSVTINALKNTIARRAQAAKSGAAQLPKKEAELYYAGENAFKSYCATCHGPTGDGIQNVAPPLAGSEWVLHNDVSVPIRILLNGINGPLQVAGKRYGPPEYTGTMPGLRDNIETNNGVIASILTYVRNAWGNKAPAINVATVAGVRQATANRKQPYSAAELDGKQAAPATAAAKK